MTFTNKNVNPGLIIKDYKVNKYNCEVEYLDGSVSQYFCSEDESDRIRDKMINQAKERQEKINLTDEQIFKVAYLGGSLISAFGVSVFYSNNEILLEIISLTVLFYSIYNVRKRKKRIDELKKYRMFFDMIDKLDIINNSEFLKCIDFDKMYQIPFDINSLDEYSYNNVKTIYKKINKKEVKLLFLCLFTSC